jgi:hypothetical protein
LIRFSRRSALVGILALAACSGGGPSGPPPTFEPLAYDYLNPIRLNVASIGVEPRVPPPGAGQDVTALDPAPPVAAITRMAQDRLRALGPSGRAVLVISDASIVRRGDAYEGSFAVELDVYTSANVKAAFAEARVSGRRSVTSGESTQSALYALTKTLMDQLNIELEYQVRRGMRDWLVAAPTSETPPVDQQALPPPPGASEEQDRPPGPDAGPDAGPP